MAWFEQKAIDLAIGHIRGFIRPTDAEREAAFELFIELSVRITKGSIDGERGSIRDEIGHLVAMSEITTSILRSHGCDVGRGRTDGSITLAVLALRVLNDIIEPRRVMWHASLSDHEAGRPETVGRREWEADWDDRIACVADLAAMRRDIRAYMDTLAAIAGTPALTDAVVPLPPSSPIQPRVLTAPLEPTSIAPREHMVRWLNPLEATQTAFHHGRFLLRRFFGRAGQDPAPEFQETKITAGDDGTTWIDYVSDMGDGFDPTAAVAWQLASPSITLPVDRTGELPEPPTELPQGQLLIMGGDQIYPHATDRGYERQLELPYRMAVHGHMASTAATSLEGEAPSAADLDDEARPQLLAIPGNHDLYGGPEHFERVFVDAEDFVGHWQTPQQARWWAVRLPRNWWLWGIDTGLDNSVCDEQRAYFASAAEALQRGDRVIVCSPVPMWQLHQKHQQKYTELRAFLDGLVRPRGARTRVFLSGDSHFFAHYRRVDGAAEEHHITAGGGGAFMQPTHNLPEQVPFEAGAPTFKLESRWPRPVESRAIATSVGSVFKPQFLGLIAVLAAVHTAMAALVGVEALRFGSDGVPESGPSLGWALSTVLRSAGTWPLLALIVAAMVMATTPNSGESRLTTGARRYGALHGVAHAALLVAVPAALLWAELDSLWLRYLAAPALAGLVATALFVAAVRWINGRIKANDTIAFSPAHSTRYKHFVRMCIDRRGDLSIFVVGLDPVGKGWHQALTTPQRSVPPSDPNGVSHLHYVWGKRLSSGSEDRMIERTHALGRDHPETIRARVAWARRLGEDGQTNRAIAELENALEASTRVNGVDHGTTFWITLELARLLDKANRPTRRIEILQQVVDAYQATLESSEPKGGTQGERLNLAEGLEGAERHDDARQLLRELLAEIDHDAQRELWLEVRRRLAVLDVDPEAAAAELHEVLDAWDTNDAVGAARVRSNLERALRGAGRAEEAATLETETRDDGPAAGGAPRGAEIWSRTAAGESLRKVGSEVQSLADAGGLRGNRQIEVLWAHLNEAVGAGRAGDPAGALHRLRQLQERCSTMVGLDSGFVGRLRLSLGRQLRRSGELDAAIELLEALRLDTDRAEDEELARLTRNELAIGYVDAGRRLEAVDLVRAELEKQEDIGERDDEAELQACCALARVLLKAEEPASAERHLNDRQVAFEALGPRNPVFLDSVMLRARSARLQNKHDEAVEFMRICVASYDEDQNRFMRFKSQRRLANTLETRARHEADSSPSGETDRAQRPPQGMSDLRQALELRTDNTELAQDLFGDAAPEVLEERHSVAVLTQALHGPAVAVPLIEPLVADSASARVDDRTAMRNHRLMAVWREAAGDHSGALEAWEDLLATAPDAFGADPADVNEFRIEVGRLSLTTGDLDRAVALLEQARRACAEDAADPGTAVVRATHLLALAHRERGDAAAAAQAFREARVQAAATLPITDPLRVEIVAAGDQIAR